MINYSIIFDSRWINRILDFSATKVKESEWEDITRGHRVLVLGNEINAYYHADLATPYLNWELSRLHFDNIDYYDNLDQIYTNFTNDLPEIIVDPGGIMQRVFEHLPLLEERYTRNGDYYRLKGTS